MDSETQTNVWQWKPVVGEQVVYQSGYREKPIVVVVVRVTPAGRIAISTDSGKALFKRGSKYIGGDLNSIPCYEAKNYGNAEVCALEHLELLTKNHEKYVAAQQEKKQQENENQAERDRQYAQEMDEVKAAFVVKVNFDQEQGYAQEMGETVDLFSLACNGKETFPDGTRLYTLHLPVKPELAERKKGYEVLIVKCKNNTHWRDEKLVVESCHAWFNGSTRSFTSCTNQHYATDEDAVWAAACSCYHSTW